MGRAPTPDPRTLSPTPAEEGVRPTVALPRQGLPTPVLVAIAVAAAVILFLVLESRRQSLAERPETVQSAAPGPAAPPPLVLPPTGQGQALPPAQVVVPQPVAPTAVQPQQPQPRTQPQVVYVPQPASPPALQAPSPPLRVSAEPALVVDTTGRGAIPQPDAAEGESAPAPSATRARAGVLANRSTTIAQGTLIPAVMETALNSSRPGFARAIVTRDVRGFDGTRVLVPRGSRLVGEYGSDTQPGQRRALVNWTRLIRPDGVTIALGSPATDPLGRGGIRADSNSHFFERFGGAILRSVVDVGLTVAAGAANAPVVLLPGGIGANVPDTQPREVPPTLSVRAGTSISVFVARDLDFTGAERLR